MILVVIKLKGSLQKRSQHVEHRPEKFFWIKIINTAFICFDQMAQESVLYFHL